jgi:hypothetical protein
MSLLGRGNGATLTGTPSVVLAYYLSLPEEGNNPAFTG